MLNQETVQQVENADLVKALGTIAQLFPGCAVFSSSLGQEDQVITDAIFRNNIPISIFTIDTGRLFNETYELLEKTEARYNAKIKVFFPNAVEVEEYVSTKGVNGFYESIDARKACCHIRKVEPLNRALKGARLWVTGLRAQQSAARKKMPILEWVEDRRIYKFNPLINWTYDEMMVYLHKHRVPYNTLHDKGFISIGCAPCTRAIEQGEDVRAGRWWWEMSKKECGLHQ
jgi:phosphoadenosine phosphosulfate reductase